MKETLLIEPERSVIHLRNQTFIKKGGKYGMWNKRRTAGWLINESGLYSLILSSKLPAAKRFKRWVTSEVLPAIRRHGLYAVDDMLNNPDALIEALQAYKAERMQRLALEAENAVQKQQLIEMQPKASYYDVVLNSPDLVSITEISKDYGWSA